MIAVLYTLLALQQQAPPPPLPPPPPPPPPPVTAIRAGTLIDGSGAAPVPNAVILLQGNRITAVGGGPNVAIPSGATVIDLSGWTVLPGFVDAHVHLTGHIIGDGDWQHDDLIESAAQRTLLGAAHAHQTLEAGFTTVRNVGAGEFTDIALRNAINAGWVPGPRILGAGISFGISGGHCDGSSGFQPGSLVSRGGIETGAADGVEQVREAVRYNVKHGADVIKICATGGVLSPADSVGVQQYTDEEMRAVVDAARMTERRVAAHAHGLAGIKAAVRAGVTSIEHGSILDDEAVRMMKERGTYLVPTLMAGETVERLARQTPPRLPPAIAAKALAIAPRMRESFRRAVNGGVKIALGTDAGVFAHGTNGHEFTLMVQFGMTPMQAIVAGTSSGATLLGLESDIGTVSAGRRADLVAVRGNPLQTIQILENVEFVMKDGVVFKRDGQVVGRSAAGVP